VPQSVVDFGVRLVSPHARTFNRVPESWVAAAGELVISTVCLLFSDMNNSPRSYWAWIIGFSILKQSHCSKIVLKLEFIIVLYCVLFTSLGILILVQ